MDTNIKGEITPTDPSTAYILTDFLSDFQLHIKKSANAWWMDKWLVHKLLFAFELGCPISEARSWAGITERQYKYFAKIHPEINEIREGFQSMLVLRARKKVAESLDSNLKIAWWWLQKKRADEFGRKKRSKNQGLIDWEHENRPRYKGVDDRPWTEQEKAEAEEFDRTYQGIERPMDPMKITYTYRERLDGPVYTAEEFHSPDFQKIKAGKERVWVAAGTPVSDDVSAPHR